MNLHDSHVARLVRSMLIGLSALIAVTASAQQSEEGARVAFEPNRGQIVDVNGMPRPEILYRTRSAGITLFLGRDRIGYLFSRPLESTRGSRRSSIAPDDRQQAAPPGRTLFRVDMEIVGASLSTQVESREPEESWTNYYLPQAPDGITGVPTFRSVIYHDIYPGIDLSLKGERSGVKYEFVVRPGGDPSRIRLRWIGARELVESRAGAMRVMSEAGEIIDGAPVSFQERAPGEDRDMVVTRFARQGAEITFRIGAYDHARTLVIDPTVTWATTYGGSNVDFIGGTSGSPSVAIAPDGGIVSAGHTYGDTYPTTPGVFQTTFSGFYDATVIKLRSNGARAWATFFGGSGAESAGAVAIDRSGNVYMHGNTASTDLPVTAGAFQTASAGVQDAFMLKLDNNGGRVWSTYFGGSLDESADNLAIDSSGRIIMAGTTTSTDLPTTPGAFQRTTPASTTAPYIACFTTAGAQIWTTYFGEGTADGLCVDPAGDIYLAGVTGAATFPVTPSAFQTTLGGLTDGFVAKLTSGGARLWATLVGGSNYDYALDLTADAAGNIYFAGYTLSPNYPVTPGASQGTLQGTRDGIIGSMTPSGSMRWSTYFGGASVDEFRGIAADAHGNVAAAGYTTSATLPRNAGRLQTYGGSNDVLITLFDSSGALRYSSHLGGNASDYAAGIAIDGHDVVIAGTSSSANFPVTAGALKGGDAAGDQILARICLLTPVVVAVGPLLLCHGDSVVLTASGSFSGYLWNTGESTRSIVVRQAGRYSVMATGSENCGGPYDTVTVLARTRRQPVISAGGITSICPGDTISVAANAGFLSYRWSTGDTTIGVRISRPGSYRVITIDSSGCRDTSMVLDIVQSRVPAPALATSSGAIRICRGDTLDVSARAPVAGEIFRWSDGTPGRSIAISRAGSYYLTITSSAGCAVRSDTVHVTVAAPSAGGIETPAGTTFCASDSLPLSAPAGFASYRWSTSQTTRSIRVRQAGRVTLDMVDSNGCHTRDTIDVTMRPAPRPLITVDGSLTLCKGQEVELHAAPGYTRYLWSDGSEGGIIHVGAPGRYSFTALDPFGCRGISDTVTVEVYPPPRADLSGPVVVCPVGSVRYSAVAGDRLRYRWSIIGGAIGAGEGTPAVDVQWSASGGTIRLVVEDIITGCSDSVELPVGVSSEIITRISASRSTLLCPDDSVTLDAGDGYSRYRWSTGERTRSITVRDIGRIWVEIETAGGCSGHSDTITITRNPAPLPVITIDGDRTICMGESVTLAAVGYPSYLWSTGETGASIRVDSSGIYSVAVIDANGCSGLSESVSITVRPERTIRLDSATICEGESVTLELPEGYLAYRWSTGEITRTRVVDSVGSYGAEMIDSFGCRVHVEPIVVVARTRGAQPEITRNGSGLESTPGDRYRWYRNGELLAGDTGRRIRPRGAGRYMVEVGVGSCSMFSDAWELERVAWLDTTAGSVGDRLVLHLHVVPGLDRDEKIARVDAELLFAASALYLHDVRASDGGGPPRIVRVEGGHVRLEWAGDAMEGERIFDLEFEGLAMAVPINPVALSATVLSSVDTVAIIGEGLVLLSGCEIAEGFRFGRAVRIESLHPNPVAGVGELVYRAPAGATPYVRVLDPGGREISRLQLPPATGESTTAWIAVEGIASGVYMLELVDRSESATIPFVIRK